MRTQLIGNYSASYSDSKDYIKVKGDIIPIINSETDSPNTIELEKTEKIMRYYGEGMKEEQLAVFANFLFHEGCVKGSFEDSINLIDDKLSKIKSLKFLSVEAISDLKKQNLKEVNSDMLLAKIENNNKTQLPIFLLLERNSLMKWPSDEAIEQLYNNNIDVLNQLRNSGREVYRSKITSFELSFSRLVYDLETLIALILITFPKYVTINIKEIVKKDLWKETEISRVYHENSKLHSFHQQGDFMKPLDEIDDAVKKLTENGRKNYVNKEKILLPIATKENKNTLEDVILFRRSVRKYCNTPVDIQTLSNILYYSYGVTGELKNTELKLRAVPSGGGLYPVDIYLSINNVEDLETGIYYYDPLDHVLILVNGNDLKSTSKEVSGYSTMIDNAAFTIILGANFWRNQWKYHERGYRIILLDCGHVAQNLHMMATSYGLGSSCLMGFVDDELNKLIDLDGVVEHSMYLITVGKIE